MNETQVTRNLAAQKKHRREVFWQIVIPMIVGGLCVASLVTLVVINDLNGGSSSNAADTSLIFMTIPTMFCSLVPFIIFGGIAFGLTKAIKALPPFTKRVLDAMQRTSAQVRRSSDKVTNPLIGMQSRRAGFKSMLRRKNKE